MRFIVDCMHGKLARKMRIYGFDTLYEANLDDDTILATAQKEERVIITSDKNLIERAYSERIPVVEAPLDSDVSRMTKIFRTYRLKPNLNPKHSRCPHCNSMLIKISKSQAEGVPKGVLRRKRIFYKCENCGRIYWYGSHWAKIRNFEETLKKRLNDS
jgi:uncharacterized protein with PIN domain